MRCAAYAHVRTDPFLIAKVDYPPDVYVDTLSNKALWRAARMSLQELFKEIPGLPDGFNLAAANLEGPAQLTNFVTAHIDLPREERFVEHKPFYMFGRPYFQLVRWRARSGVTRLTAFSSAVSQTPSHSLARAMKVAS